jgi:hypothetical protein
MALTDLGRFDEAWASFQEEVADEAHPFGRCMQELGLAFWLESLGALDRAEATAKRVIEEARRLSRTWMQRSMIDLLEVIAARRGSEGAELAGWVERRAEEIGFEPGSLSRAEAALARGDFAKALDLSSRFTGAASRRDPALEWVMQSGARRARIVALEVALRALAGLERWEEVLAGADAPLAEAGSAGFKTRQWRILTTRARARDATGDEAGARSDREAARAVLDDMARTIPDPELGAAFESDRDVSDARKP